MIQKVQRYQLFPKIQKNAENTLNTFLYRHDNESQSWKDFIFFQFKACEKLRRVVIRHAFQTNKNTKNCIFFYLVIRN